MTIKEIKIQYALGSLTDKMKYDIADNPNTPIEVLTILSKDESWHIRCGVAWNTNIPKELLTKLSTDDKDWHVRRRADIQLRNKTRKFLA